MKKVLAILLAIVVLAGGAFALARNNAKETDQSGADTSQTSNTGTNQQSGEPADVEEKAVDTDNIAIQNNQFTPRTVTAKVGDTITWTNRDAIQHSVVPDETGGTFVASELLPKDEIYTFTFNAPGTFKYHCGPHPGMTGTIIVSE